MIFVVRIIYQYKFVAKLYIFVCVLYLINFFLTGHLLFNNEVF